MAGGCSLDLQAVPEMADEVCDFGSKVGSDCPLKKLCVECGASKTPLWRGGPAGPKSLCNACGIRSRKKRWALLQMSKASAKKEIISEKKMKHVAMETNIIIECDKNNNYNNYSSCSSSNGHSFDSLSKDRLMAMWEVLKPHNVRIEELNEEQQAAVLLMALSHGLNYN